MPCNIGFKTYQEVYLPVLLPKKLRKKIDAPKVDLDLLNKLGETSPEFVEWLDELDLKPLLEFTLAETLKNNNTSGIEFSIQDRFVVAETEYTGSTEKTMIEGMISRVMNEFQMKTLEMIARLLEFETTIREENGDFIIEGEKANPDNNQVSRYLRIKRSANGQSEIMFEHYSSKDALKEERAKFTVLAQKFGLSINLTLPCAVGSPIAGGVEHRGHLKH